ncbi:hypothetical protein FJY94_03710 [Candidatus Kaiserbacteria bacterium]|nr:hypothetical protein [Candidatus Kaiserbacteria bacterium]
MKNFTVLYSAPIATIDEWMKTPEAERKEAEAKMMQEWNDWQAAHKDAILNTISLGRNTRVTKEGAAEMRNDLMLSSYVQAESAEAAAELFKDHPHFGIPGATIDIMEARQI